MGRIDRRKAREGFQEAINLGRDGAGGKGVRNLWRHLVRAEMDQQGFATGFDCGRQRENGRREEQFNSTVQDAQMGKTFYLGAKKGRVILPALPVVKRNRALACTGAFIGDAARKTLVAQGVVDGAAVARQIGARHSRRFVDGKGRALVKCQRHAAESGTGGAIGSQIGQMRDQPTASSKAVRKRLESSARGASEVPKRTVSPANFPTDWIATPA